VRDTPVSLWASAAVAVLGLRPLLLRALTGGGLLKVIHNRLCDLLKEIKQHKFWDFLWIT